MSPPRNPDAGKYTVADIAKKAGVSPGTVSNVLNNRKGVSEKKKKEILQIVEEMGYARTTGNQLSPHLRLVIFKHHGFVVDDTPFFSQLIGGIESAARQAGYELVITNLTTEALKDNTSTAFLHSSNEGILLLATEMTDEDIQAFKNSPTPVVVLDNHFRGCAFDSVLINNEDGIFAAVTHLVDMGHQKIGLLHSASHINNFYYRQRSFYEALLHYGLDAFPQIDLRSTMDYSYEDMKAYIEQNGTKKMPTAFVAENDIIAFGAMKALKEAGMRIPQDISIVGFDDMPFCLMSNPKLTTIRVNKANMGALAVEVLQRRIQGPQQPPLRIEECTALVVRDSVRDIRSSK